MSQDLSIVVRTHRRRDKVMRVLIRIGELDWSQFRHVEVILVENGERMGLEPESVIRPPLDLKHIHEPIPGSARAFNTGVKQASADLILAMDDDVLLEPMVPGAIIDHVPQWPQAAAFGGPLHPLWPTATPSWYSRQLSLVSGEAHRGTEVAEYPRDRNPVGAIRLFRRWVFDKYGFFEEEGGLVGNRRTGVQGARLLDALAKNEQRVYLPDFAAWHIMDESQATRRYFLRQSFNWGEGQAMRLRSYKRHLFNVPLFALNNVVRDSCRCASAAFASAPVRFAAVYRLAQSLGYASHFFNRRKKHRSGPQACS